MFSQTIDDGDDEEGAIQPVIYEDYESDEEGSEVTVETESIPDIEEPEAFSDISDHEGSDGMSEWVLTKKFIQFHEECNTFFGQGYIMENGQRIQMDVMIQISTHTDSKEYTNERKEAVTWWLCFRKGV